MRLFVERRQGHGNEGQGQATGRPGQAAASMIDLVVADNDDLDDAERARLDEALETSLASAREGTIDADELLAEIARLEPARG